MIKYYLTLFTVFCAISLNAQINDLRKAQDVRIEKFKVQKLAYFSKTTLVNPFIGTGGHGHTYPGASAPFGMMQLSPDTRYDGWDGCSGYHYSDSIIYGFSHTHLSGTGVPDYCDLLIVPQLGSPLLDPGYSSVNGYGSKFSHDNEQASPGYYQVHLDDQDIDVRLTVSERCGMHEYTFNNPSGKRFILIDLDHRDRLISASIETIGRNQIKGSRISSAWANEQHFYFFIESEENWQKARIIKKNGKNQLLLIYPKSIKTVKLKVGMSAVDENGAKKNLSNEMPNWDFNELRARVVGKWNTELDKIRFVSEDRDVMVNFYTALYHSFLNPNIFNDVDGRYRGRDNQIHQLETQEDANYTVFSLWDTYRATHPLFTITQEDRTYDFIKTFLRQYKQGGDLPVWELAGNETECMIGYHSVSVIADAFVKGLKDFDTAGALEAMIATSKFDEFGKLGFKSNGFIGVGDEPESVSKTLEYAYDEFCIAQMLSSLKGDENDETKLFRKNSLNFVNVFDPSTKFMRARRDGIWFSPFDPSEVNFNYTEANSFQYSLYAPHAVGVLSDLVGGKDSLEAWLDRLFASESNLAGRHQVDITGLIGQYAHGNEPSHHMAYLYNYTDHPEKTQVFIDRIQKEMYHNAPDGLSGNEDCGQMSSWYVLSALGIYQIAPGNPYYEFGRPMMENAEINIDSKTKFIIKTVNNSPQNKFINKVTLNGTVLDRRYISHAEIMQGGVLIFEMSNEPSAYGNESAPTISKIPNNFVSVPFFIDAQRVFEQDQKIVISSALPGQTIHYTLDGTEPTSQAPVYSEPIIITNNTTVKAKAVKGSFSSATITNSFVKKRNDVHISITGEYANQYAAGGEFTLIDGIRGGNEFRTGDWQGYWDQDVEFELTFDNKTKLDSVGIGVLRDMKSWIFYPEFVEFEIGYANEEGSTTKKRIDLPAPNEHDQFQDHKTLSIELDASIPVNWVKVRLKSFPLCPEWHLGAGNPTWLFVDELYFKEVE